jgi:undecaprenyl-diphosphatase
MTTLQYATVAGQWIVRQDTRLLLSMRRRAHPLLERLARAATRAGNTGSWLLHVLVLAVLPMGPDREAVAALALGTLCATGAAQAIKRGIRRPRPNCAIEGFRAVAANPDAWSFPSGHTAAAFGAATAAAGVHAGLGSAELALAVMIGLSRIYLGAHYPLDVAMGALVGSACGIAAGRIAASVGLVAA